MKKSGQKEATIPFERHETLRKEMISEMERGPLTAREISGIVRIPQKEVFEHLEHIQRTLSNKESSLLITPARCIQCGFIFKKRERLKDPGKCPVCRSQHIQEPLFSIRRKDGV